MNSDKIYAAIVLAFIVFIMGTSARINSSKPKPKYEPEPLQWSVSNLNERYASGQPILKRVL